MLWITHYNPNGTVADCLPFDDLKGYHAWVQTHPDFCDVDVKKLARHELHPEEDLTPIHPPEDQPFDQ